MEPVSRTNHLAEEASPYLRQHMHNPVEWYPWGEEALGRAREEHKPIFLSIGYAACHWCHVMEQESFENEEVAGFLAAHFISIKVDREERPDLDALYMDAVMALTRSGGWPLNVFLTPSLKPFYGGTYFPPGPQMGRPGFLDLLRELARLWQEDPGRIVDASEELIRHLRRRNDHGRDIEARELVRSAQEALMARADKLNGGLGSRPKFPEPVALRFLLHAGGESAAHALATLRKMAAGGIFDHLAGGFHRYSVDALWLVPHFEKMLYDNALLAELYLDAYQESGETAFASIAERTLDFLLLSLRSPEGGFYATLDADSEGEEGAYYLWTRDEILRVLGEEEGERVCERYNVRPQGNFVSPEAFHQGRNILHHGELEGDVPEDSLQRLLEHRSGRVAPAVDTKIITGWNGLVLSALARAASLLGEARFLEAATQTAAYLHEHHVEGGRVVRSICEGVRGPQGVLEDYIFLARGLFDLYEATFAPSHMEAARDLMEAALERFADEDAGGLLFTAAQDIVVPVKRFEDGAVPSANGMAMTLLHQLQAIFGGRFGARAREIEREAVRAASAFPGACPGVALAVGPAHVDELRTVVITGNPDLPETRALVEAARRARKSADVVVTPRGWGQPLLLFRGKGVEPAVHICQEGTCSFPLTDPDAVRSVLQKEV